MHPWCTLGVRVPGAAGSGAAEGSPGCVSWWRLAASSRAALASAIAVLRVEPRHVLELVHHVAIGAERESSVVAELAGDVDHRAPLVE